MPRKIGDFLMNGQPPLVIVVGCGWKIHTSQEHRLPPHDPNSYYLIDTSPDTDPDAVGDFGDLVSGQLAAADGQIDRVIFEYVCNRSSGGSGFVEPTFRKWMNAANQVLKVGGAVNFISGNNTDRQTVKEILEANGYVTKSHLQSVVGTKQPAANFCVLL